MLKKTLLATAALVALASGVHAEDLKEFRIGILGGENEADRLRNFQCMTEKLPSVLGVEKVSLFPAADYDGVVQGLLGGTLDYAELGASAFAKVYLAKADAVEPILTTVQTDGSSGYYSIMVARKDSGIAKIEDIKGKKLGYADPDSTSGYLVPMVTLPEAIGEVARAGQIFKFFAGEALRLRMRQLERQVRGGGLAVAGAAQRDARVGVLVGDHPHPFGAGTGLAETASSHDHPDAPVTRRGQLL
mgnify:CR=1 FL=1